MPIEITYTDKADLERQVREKMDEYEAARRDERVATFRKDEAAAILSELIPMLESVSRTTLDDAKRFMAQIRAQE